MADRALRFDLLGRDRTLSRTLGQAEGRFKRFGGAALKMGAVISGAFAGIAIGGFLKGAIDEAREAQRTGKQTAAVIKSTGGAARISAKQVGLLATAISNTVGVDDELIQSGENWLLTFKNVRNEAGKGNRIFDRASRAAVDLAASMHQGEVSATGLHSANTQLGKALNDPIKGITALNRAGVTFNAEQQKEIKTLVEHGHRLEAQKIILAEVESQTAGFAKASADPWRRLGVVWKNLQEAFGTTLLPVLNTVVDWLGRILPSAFSAFGRITAPLTRFLEAHLPGALKTAQLAVGALFDAFSGKGVTAGGFIGVIGQIGVAARGLYGTGQEAAGRLIAGVQSRLNTWRPTLAAFRDNVVAGVQRFGQPIINALTVGVKTGNWEPLGRALGTAVVAALQGVENLGAAVGGFLRRQFGQIDWYGLGKDIGRQAIPFAVGFSATLLDGLLTAAREHPLDTLAFLASFIGVGKMGGVISKLLERVPFLRAFAPMFQALHELTEPLNNTIGRVLRAMGRAFARGLGLESVQMGRAIARRFDGLRLQIWSFGERFAKAGLNVIERLGKGIRDGGRFIVAADRAVDRILGRFLGVLFNPISSSFTRAGGSIVGHLAEGMRRLGTAVSRAASATISRIVSPFRGAADWLVNAGRNVVAGLRNGISSAIGSVGGVLGQLKDAIVGGIKRLFGIQSPSTVMAGLGSHMVAGLVKGLLGSQGGLHAVVRSLGLSTADLLGHVLGGAWQQVKGTWSKITTAIGGVVNLAGLMVRGLSPAEAWIIQHESGGRTTAQNPTSTAFGLGQLLLANRQRIGGILGFSPSTTDFGQQLAMFRYYYRERYGSADNAKAFWQAHGWYGSGLTPTVFSRPTLIGVGERGPETVSVTPQGRPQPGGEIDYRRLGQEVARALAGVQLVVKPENLVTGLRAHKRTLGGQALGLS